MPKPLRGELWWCDWSPGRGSEQMGRRPSLVIQTDLANKRPAYTNTIVLAVSTSGLRVPSHIPVSPSKRNGLQHPSFVQCEQVMTVSCDRLEEYIGDIDEADMRKVESALGRVLGMW